MKRNRVQIMPLPPSQATAATELSEESSSPKSISQDVPPLNILSRPKRLIKPSLKALENMEL